MFKVLGISTFDYVSKKTLKKTTAHSLYLIDTKEYDNTIGNRTDQVFVTDQMWDDNSLDLLDIGDIIEISYTKTGYIDRINIFRHD